VGGAVSRCTVLLWDFCAAASDSLTVGAVNVAESRHTALLWDCCAAASDGLAVAVANRVVSRHAVAVSRHAVLLLYVALQHLMVWLWVRPAWPASLQ
jgi:hypothetical protein